MTDKQKIEAIEDILNDEQDYKMLACKPCPFCGGDSIQVRISGHIHPWKQSKDGRKAVWYHCECYECSASRDMGSQRTIEEAISVWNERSEV